MADSVFSGSENTTKGFKVIHKLMLTESVFVLRFTRNKMKFRAGQHILVGLSEDMEQREYSIYSGENDDFLEILVKEVKDGNVSSKLSDCKQGDILQVDGPFGSFGIENFNIGNKKHIFIATGTGISPFHSMTRSHKNLNYNLIHGVRFISEAYESSSYESERYILCTSGEKYSGRKGRVTTFLQKFSVRPDMLFYLCGNGSMIYEVYHILRDKGVSSDRIFSEIYF